MGPHPWYHPGLGGPPGDLRGELDGILSGQGDRDNGGAPGR